MFWNLLLLSAFFILLPFCGGTFEEPLLPLGGFFYDALPFTSYLWCASSFLQSSLITFNRALHKKWRIALLNCRRIIKAALLRLCVLSLLACKNHIVSVDAFCWPLCKSVIFLLPRVRLAFYQWIYVDSSLCSAASQSFFKFWSFWGASEVFSLRFSTRSFIEYLIFHLYIVMHIRIPRPLAPTALESECKFGTVWNGNCTMILGTHHLSWKVPEAAGRLIQSVNQAARIERITRSTKKKKTQSCLMYVDVNCGMQHEIVNKGHHTWDVKKLHPKVIFMCRMYAGFYMMMFWTSSNGQYNLVNVRNFFLSS